MSAPLPAPVVRDPQSQQNFEELERRSADARTNGVPPGAITAFGGTAAPAGWQMCDGSSLSRTSYPQLFGAIGTTYGAADSTHFSLPDLRGRVPMGVDGSAGRISVASDTLGAVGGAERVTLLSTESGMPDHYHSVTDVFGNALTYSAGGSSGSAVNTIVGGLGMVTSHASQNASNSHQNLAPYQVVNYIIKT